MNGYSLRPANLDDAQPCGIILREWMNETEWFHTLHTPDEDAPFVASKIAAGTTTVAEHNREIAGFLVLEADYVACLYVRRAHRNKGLGKLFLDFAREKNRSGLNLFTFQANAAARRFYEREGFIIEMMTDGSANDEGIPDVMYVWEGLRA